jgi:hypothetical protein
MMNQRQLTAMWLGTGGIGMIGIVGMAYADRYLTAGSSVFLFRFVVLAILAVIVTSGLIASFAEKRTTKKEDE